MIDKIFGRILTSRQNHAKWLNTFSYAELIGFRKIVASHGAEAFTLDLLSHAIEECRHALLLKKQALKIGGSAFNTYSVGTLIAAAETKNYFLDLAAFGHEFLSKTFADPTGALMNYLLVTSIVETRALQIYEGYCRALTGAGHPVGPLRGLLLEEHSHLARVEEELNGVSAMDSSARDAMMAAERNLFDRWLRAALAELEAEHDSA